MQHEPEYHVRALILAYIRCKARTRTPADAEELRSVWRAMSEYVFDERRAEWLAVSSGPIDTLVVEAEKIIVGKASPDSLVKLTKAIRAAESGSYVGFDRTRLN